MIPPQTLLFDLDDTLIHCNKYFNESLELFAEWMVQRFPDYSKEELLKKQLALDLAGVQQHGFLKERFPESLVETYRFFSQRSGRSEDPDEMKRLYEMGFGVYDQNYESYPFMEETLQTLRLQGHRLILYTGGEPTVQKVKVEQLGLRRFFEDRIHVVQHKNTAALRAVLNERDCHPESTWMIGNSARTDIIPALENGIHAIFIPNEQEWEYHRADIRVTPRGALIELKSLKDVPSAISAYLGQSG